MEYFVRTSHIVSGMIYLTLFLACIGSVLAMILSSAREIQDAVNVFFGLTIGSIFFLIAFSCLHYIVLKSFHPWAKMPEKNPHKDVIGK